MSQTLASGPVKCVPVNAGQSDNTLVGAVTGRKIRVLGLALVASAATVATLESDTGGTAISGEMPLTTAPLVLPVHGIGYCETVAGELLNLNGSTAATIDGFLIYQEVQ